MKFRKLYNNTVIYSSLVVTAYLHIPSCYCFHIFFYWVSSAAPAEERKKNRHNKWKSLSLSGTKDTHTQIHTQRKICLKSPHQCQGKFERRAVWSHQGQTVARHPEELPLCLCTATSCNLLLRDKTKLTWHFTADLTVISDRVHQIWLKQLWRGRPCAAAYSLQNKLVGLYPAQWYWPYTDHCHRQLSTFTQVLMCNLLPFLPCGIVGYFPTLTTSELTFLSVGIKNNRHVHKWEQ